MDISTLIKSVCLNSFSPPRRIMHPYLNFCLTAGACLVE